MDNLKNIISTYLRQTADSIDSDSCILSQEESNYLLSQIMHIELKKSEAAERLGISTRTFDRRVSAGELPQGKHVMHHKDLVWYLDEIISKENDER